MLHLVIMAIVAPVQAKAPVLTLPAAGTCAEVPTTSTCGKPAHVCVGQTDMMGSVSNEHVRWMLVGRNREALETAVRNAAAAEPPDAATVLWRWTDGQPAACAQGCVREGGTPDDCARRCSKLSDGDYSRRCEVVSVDACSATLQLACTEWWEK